jgi:hypothetical protein
MNLFFLSFYEPSRGPSFNSQAAAINTIAALKGVNYRAREIGNVPSHFTSEKPNLIWQRKYEGIGVKPLDAIRDATNFAGIGYLKDGTHGKYRYPERGEWCKGQK